MTLIGGLDPLLLPPGQTWDVRERPWGIPLPAAALHEKQLCHLWVLHQASLLERKLLGQLRGTEEERVSLLLPKSGPFGVQSVIVLLKRLTGQWHPCPMY